MTILAPFIYISLGLSCSLNQSASLSLSLFGKYHSIKFTSIILCCVDTQSNAESCRTHHADTPTKTKSIQILCNANNEMIHPDPHRDQIKTQRTGIKIKLKKREKKSHAAEEGREIKKLIRIACCVLTDNYVVCSCTLFL